MSSHLGASGIGETSKNRGSGYENPSEGNRRNESHNQWMKATRPWLSAADQAQEQFMKPALSGRKERRKTIPEDNQRRREEGNQERDVGRCFGGKDRGQVLTRKMEPVCVDRVQDGVRRGTSDSCPHSYPYMQLNCISGTDEPSDHSERQQRNPRSQTISFTRPTITNMKSHIGRSAIQNRFSHPSSQTRFSGDSDPLWAEVRTGASSGLPSQNHSSQRYLSDLEDKEEEDENKESLEEGRGLVEVTGRGMHSANSPPCNTSGERRSKRENSRIESLRRRQRRRQRWRPSQQQESTQSSTEIPTTSSDCSSTEDEEALSMREKEGFICAVCLDVYFNPYMCHPCNHIFCEPCLRTLAKDSPTNTPCPLCRTIITHVFFQKELNQTAKTFFPEEYLSRKQNFQRAPCSKWPLPSCRKLFRIFRGFQGQSNPNVRRQFPHGGGFPLDTIEFENDSRGWRLDMDMVIIYIYSVNWIIGFFIFCFLCYLFFPSFWLS